MGSERREKKGKVASEIPGSQQSSDQPPAVRPSLGLAGLAKLSQRVRRKADLATTQAPTTTTTVPPASMERERRPAPEVEGPASDPQVDRITPSNPFLIEPHRAATAMPENVDDLRLKMHELFARGHFEAALEQAMLVTAVDPTSRQAHDCAAMSRDKLVRFYKNQLGSLEQIPVLRVAPDKMRQLSIDSRVGFVMHLINGEDTLEEILDLTSMPLLEALRIICDLVDNRLVLLT